MKIVKWCLVEQLKHPENVSLQHYIYCGVLFQAE